MDITLLENLDLGESHESVTDVKYKCRKLEDVEESIIRSAAKPTYRYSREQLLKYRDHPLSLKAPELRDDLKFLFEKEPGKQQAGKDDSEGKKPSLKKTTITRSFDKTVDKLDPSKKIESSRGTEKLSVTFRNDKPDDSRKTTDRLRKESEICLSPQRKSFNSGCSVQSAKAETTSSHPETNSNSSNTNLSKQALQKFPYRDTSIIATGNARDLRSEPKENRNRDLPPRRIGSGRIISSDPSSFIRNYPDNRTISKEKPQVVFKCTFQKSQERDNHDSRDRDSIWDRQKNVVHYERRKYPEQNFDDDNKNHHHHHRHQWDQQQRVNNFFERRKNYQSDYHRDHDDEEKEPEWMREGPDSKHDFIELRGFDDQELKSFRRGGNSRTTRSGDDSKISKANIINKAQPEKTTETVIAATVTTAADEPKILEESTPSCEETENKIKPTEASSIEINLEEIFGAPLPDIISESKAVEASGSRFTRWFTQPETSSQKDENKPKPVEDGTDIKNLRGADMNTLIYENDSAQRQSDGIVPSSFMDLFRTKENKIPQAVETQSSSVEPTGKLHSLEEIEAKLRGADSAKQAALNASNIDRKKKEEETEAFRKLLCQAFKANPGSNSVQKLLESNMNMNDLAEKMRGENQLRRTGPQGFCNGDSLMNIPNLMQHAAHLSKMQSISSNPQFHHQIQLQQLNHHSHVPQPQQQQQQQQQQHPFHHQAQQLTSADMMRLFQQQQQTRSQQEVFSRMLASSGANFNSPSNASAFRPPQVSSTDGPFAHVSQEIQMWVNSYTITMDVLKQQETKHLIQRIKHRELTALQLIEQLKKTPPYQTKFRESALCTLKWLQTHEPLLAVCPPTSMSFAVPPPQSTSAASALTHAQQTTPFGENMIQQMMMNQPYRNAPIPDIVYQREFSVHNQNLFQNNLGNAANKFSSPQMSSANQTSQLRLNSSLGMNTTNNGSLNLPNTTNTVREEKSGLSPMTNLNSPGPAIPKSLPFTPTSVLLKLSAEKENLDHSLTKDNNEPTKAAHMNNQNTSMRNAFVNGMPSGEGTLNRLFLSDVASQPRSSSNQMQNMMSVEELERVQQSVRN